MRILISLLLFLMISSCKKHVENSQFEGFKFSESLSLRDFKEDKNDFRNDRNDVIKITYHDMNPEQARSFITKKSGEIKLMFAPQAVPYFGEITKSTACTSQIEIDKKTKDIPSEISVYFNLTATERFIYGACIPEQENYKSQYLLLYCPSRGRLAEIKYFYDKRNTFVEQIAHCN